jgi:hypothetical protein
MAYVLQAAFIYVVPSVVLVVFNRLVHNFLRTNERNLSAHTTGVRRPSQPVVAAEAAVLPTPQRRYSGDAQMLLLQPNEEKTTLDDCLKEVCCVRLIVLPVG